MIDMMISIVYVDDDIDNNLSRYLGEFCSSDPHFACSELKFNNTDTYLSLLNNEDIRKSNILLIDSRLFKEADAASNQLSGEVFRVIINKVFPYIEVVVISQNAMDVEWCVVPKCKTARSYSEFKEYYDKELGPILREKSKKICETRRILASLENKDTVETALLEKLQRSIAGETEYDELKASDIDNMIEAFKELIAKG